MSLLSPFSHLPYPGCKCTLGYDNLDVRLRDCIPLGAEVSFQFGVQTTISGLSPRLPGPTFELKKSLISTLKRNSIKTNASGTVNTLAWHANMVRTVWIQSRKARISLSTRAPNFWLARGFRFAVQNNTNDCSPRTVRNINSKTRLRATLNSLILVAPTAKTRRFTLSSAYCTVQ